MCAKVCLQVIFITVLFEYIFVIVINIAIVKKKSYGTSMHSLPTVLRHHFLRMKSQETWTANKEKLRLRRVLLD